MSLQYDAADGSDVSAPLILPALPYLGGGRHAPRSRSGCWTCRTKKVKCDEERPQCRRCLRLKLLCDYAPRRKTSSRDSRPALYSRMRRSSMESHGSLVEYLQPPLLKRWFESLQEQDVSVSLSTFRIPAPATGSCSVVFTAADHESVRYFRTSFAKLHHTKNPDYSLYSIMFNVAKKDPTVMHMVLAISGREIEFRQSNGAITQKEANSPLRHYSNALKSMADVIGDGNKRQLDLDSIHTALYLMLIYEQKYGDERCSGVANHLNGASLLLRNQCEEQLQVSLPALGSHPNALETPGTEVATTKSRTLSLYSARMIVWLALFDSAATLCGVGGQLHGTIYEMMKGGDSSAGCDVRFQPFEHFDRLHRFSNPLYRTIWGESYPQSELLDDVENRSIFSLLGACSQLRHMIAQLAKLYDIDKAMAKERARIVEVSIQNVRIKFSELIEVAAELSLGTDNSHRLVANIRAVVPHFYAALLDFFRLTRFEAGPALSMCQIDALRHIMNLAFQSYKHGGDEAMMRVAWPMFMVALETDDHVHRDWVFERFHSLSKFGKNFERARQFLIGIVDAQSRLGRRVDVRERFQSGQVGLFVI